MVILEILKAQFAKGLEKSLYYFRDSKGFEVDLIIADGRTIIPVEIKSASTYDKDFSKNLRKFCEFAKNSLSPTVVYSGNLELEAEGIKCINFKNCGNLID